ncbi:hypothetical protein SB49_15625 [Sediminicola sp. YIK13]|uniref:hypothetical protein n=1 Tax=Sediminicola sp. YIK13 TaxID=1453352 RepID=UPI00071FB369|nr:hypothetical protein [Sediminicola sp. YIK13]ALM09060.1 hypothetical protein SB49_15625 [Sediminicola sp. YIK13]
MKLIIKLFGIFLLVAGISLLFYPELLIGWIKDNMENTSLYITAIGIRLVIGLLFIVAARQSKYPAAIKLIGYLFIVAAIVLMFIGPGGFQHFISTIIPEVKPYAPLAGILSMVFGGYIIYAFTTNKKISRNQIKP